MNTAMNELRAITERRLKQCEKIIAQAEADATSVSPDAYAKAQWQARAYQTVLLDIAFCVSISPEVIDTLAKVRAA